MTKLEQKQAQLIASINALGDCFDQYSYLLVRSNDLPPLPEKYRTPSYLVKGCQSKVWIHTAYIGGKLHLDCDSDALILKGILAIFRDLIEGADAQELSALDWRLLSDTELGATFTSDRSAGMRRVMQIIQESARQIVQ